MSRPPTCVSSIIWQELNRLPKRGSGEEEEGGREDKAKPVSFAQREKRKRDIGQTSRTHRVLERGRGGGGARGLRVADLGPSFDLGTSLALVPKSD